MLNKHIGEATYTYSAKMDAIGVWSASTYYSVNVVDQTMVHQRLVPDNVPSC